MHQRDELPSGAYTHFQLVLADSERVTDGFAFAKGRQAGSPQEKAKWL
jgi:hypothetical protein